MAIKAEYILKVLFDRLEDPLAEFGAGTADLAAKAVVGLADPEEAAYFVDERALAAEVDGVLPGAFAVGETVVGSETLALVGAPGGDDGALAGEAEGFILEELECGMWVHLWVKW